MAFGISVGGASLCILFASRVASSKDAVAAAAAAAAASFHPARMPVTKTTAYKQEAIENVPTMA
eukprot:scaffold592293_cov67-Attheya_sp.AAC.1